MRHNPRIMAFRAKLEAAGITMRVLWETRRDGKSLSNSRPFNDVYFVSFVGDGFSPAIGTGIIIDYGDRDGFGLFLEAPSAAIDGDVARIKSGDVMETAMRKIAEWAHPDCGRGSRIHRAATAALEGNLALDGAEEERKRLERYHARFNKRTDQINEEDGRNG